MQRYTISPNNPVVEDLISGQFRSGELITIYGNASSGKTTTCLLATAEAAKQGKVIFIDTENGCNSERMTQLGFDDKSLSNIFLFQPKSFWHQQSIIKKIKELCQNEKIVLVVVDTIGNHYRLALNANPDKINKAFVEQLQIFVRIARDLNKVVLMTNQVYSDLKSRDIKMVGGNIAVHLSKCVIELKKSESSRIATIVKYKMPFNNTTYYNLGKTVKFNIEEKGIFISQH